MRDTLAMFAIILGLVVHAWAQTEVAPGQLPGRIADDVAKELESDDLQTALRAVGYLRRGGRSAIEMLPELLSHPSARVRRAALSAFLDRRDPQVERAACAALEDEDDQVRDLAYSCLQVQGEHTLPELVKYVDGLGMMDGAVARLGPFWTGSSGSVAGYDWSPDSKLLAVAERAGRVSIWAWRAGTAVSVVPVMDVSRGVRWTQDGRIDASAATLGEGLRDAWCRVLEGMSLLDVAPDGREIILAGLNTDFRILSEGGVVRRLPQTSEWEHASWSPCGGYLAVAGADSIAVLAQDDARALWQRAAPSGSHFAGSCDFCPDGSRIAFGGWPGIVITHAWSGETLRVLGDDRFWTSCPIWSPDGRYLAVQDSMSNVWILDSLPRPSGGASIKGEASLPAVLWEDLSSPSVEVASRAEERLVGAGRAGVAYVAERVEPVAALSKDEMLQLARSALSIDDGVRAGAQRQLARLGASAADALLGSPVAGADPTRVASLTHWLRTCRTDLRTIRALSVLARLEDSGGRLVLSHLAAGAHGAPLTAAAAGLLRACQ